ncbi:DUF6702 family protein [Rhodopirellula halodulae]|uniref:DUF6702 family protein n=1 Tax=Rhodopirellula halodulae TaxID=2894198 RepID=UPI001E426BA8|nr:DUF6702 family protein [Rhodopirellula sp. JC737]MCC9658179.1 hypothetical protein [Rhodopirellula sp. JC737]
MISALCACGILLSGVLMHPTRETLCELQWNDESQSIEIAFRLSLGDEERLLKEAKTRLQRWESEPTEGLDTNVKLKPQQVAFGRHMTFSNDESCPPAETRSNAAQFRWIGRQEEGIHVWWFLEYSSAKTDKTNGDGATSKPVTSKPPTYVRCDLFAEAARTTPHPNGHPPHDAFQNTFIVLGHPVPVSAVITPREPVAKLQWPE